MSRITSQSFTCPKCKYKGEFKKYDSVNVTLDTELREKVLSGDIFDWTCPNCCETYNIRYDLLYHDMDKGFQIYYSPNNSAEINKTISDMAKKFPGVRRDYRTVASLNALREKVFIFEKGLNDIAIEFVKAMLKFGKNEISEDVELRFLDYFADKENKSKGKLAFKQILDDQPLDGVVIYEKEIYDKILNEVQTNDKFKMTGLCETIDERWILNRMK